MLLFFDRFMNPLLLSNVSFRDVRLGSARYNRTCGAYWLVSRFYQTAVCPLRLSGCFDSLYFVVQGGCKALLTTTA